MKKYIFFQLIWLVVLVSACQPSSTASVKKITSEELSKLIQNSDVQLIDVRTPKELTNGFIQGASNLDFNNSDFEALSTKYDKDKPVIVYCASGIRSAKSAEKLSKLGFKEIYNLGGGIRQWQSDGFPVVNE